MWLGHLGQKTIAGHRMELRSRGILPPHCVSYRKYPTARQFAANWIRTMLQGEVIEPAGTECVTPITFVTKLMAHWNSWLTTEDWTRILIASFPLQMMNDYIQLFAATGTFSTLNQKFWLWKHWPPQTRQAENGACRSSQTLSVFEIVIRLGEHTSEIPLSDKRHTVLCQMAGSADVSRVFPAFLEERQEIHGVPLSIIDTALECNSQTQSQ